MMCHGRAPSWSKDERAQAQALQRGGQVSAWVATASVRKKCQTLFPIGVAGATRLSIRVQTVRACASDVRGAKATLEAAARLLEGDFEELDDFALAPGGGWGVGAES